MATEITPSQGLSSESGATEAKTQRVVLATDSPGVASAAAISTAVKNADYVLVATYTAAIGATSVLPTAFTATLPANVVAIMLIPQGDVYCQSGGAASVNTVPVPLGGILIRGTKTVLDLVQVFAASVRCSMLVYGPRS